MRKFSKQTNSGFTLMEIIIYIGLFSIVVGGGMIATYQIIQSTDAGINHTILQEEANFVLRKISWAMNGVDSFTIVASPASLTVLKSGSPNLKFDLNSSNLRLTKGTGSPQILNTSSISVSDLSFTQIGSGVTAAFILTTAQNGRNVSQTFSSTKYLRQ